MTTVPPACVVPQGELDISTLPHLDRSLRIACEAEDEVVLDLRELDFIDSSGGHFLIAAPSSVALMSWPTDVMRVWVSGRADVADTAEPDRALRDVEERAAVILLDLRAAPMTMALRALMESADARTRLRRRRLAILEQPVPGAAQNSSPWA